MIQIIRFANGTGHATQTFDTTVVEQRSLAEQLFNAQLQRGALIFSTDTQPREMMLEYDPQVENVFVSYPMVGG